MKRVVFYSRTFSSILASDIIGGAEIQQYIIAKNLKPYYNIIFITDDPKKEIKNKEFELLFIPELKHKHFPLKQYHIISDVIKSLGKAKGDIYYIRGLSISNLPVALYSFLTKKRFILAFSCDMHCYPEKVCSDNLIKKFLCRFSVKLADTIIAQTKGQARLIKENYNYKKDIVVINSGHEIPEQKPDIDQKDSILWVATIHRCKQPRIFLEIAGSFPKTKFILVGGPSSHDLSDNCSFYNSIKSEAEKIPNLEFKGFVPFDQVSEYFRKAKVLINTSEYEGFSNTFIQAWANATPIVSLNVDPDSILTKYNIGFLSKTLSQMKTDLSRLFFDKELYQKMSDGSYDYAKQNHSITQMIDKYKQVMEI